MNRMDDRKAWRDVGAIDDIRPLGARVVVAKDHDIAVFRTASDDVFAVHDRCPHKGGRLSQGIVHGRSVTCPLHNWIICLTDGRAAAPDEGYTPSVPVRVEGRRILLAVDHS